MAAYAVFECKNPTCKLRFPLDTKKHRGEFCPRCGGKLERVAEWQNRSPSEPSQVVPRRRIRGVLDNIRSSFNVGEIFRTADGVGVEHLYLCGITPTPAAHPSMAKTALGAERVIPWSSHQNALALIKYLREEGFCLLALERTPGAVPFQDFSLRRLEDQPIALILGHERAGVDPGLLEVCDLIVSLPMAGAKASLNVAVAFAVAAYGLAL